MLEVDYLVVGSGLTGSVIARLLVDAGREVFIVDRRPHHGGNVYDHVHPCGIRVHTYGPHYFRTSSERIWEFVHQFDEFYPYEACLKSIVDGQYENWPIAASYITRHIGHDWKPEFTAMPQNFEQAALSLMPRLIYDKFVKEYNEKQWGVAAQTLSAELCKRFDVRDDDEARLTPKARYQGIPQHGYAALMRNMIDGIPVALNVDYLQLREMIGYRRMLIFTGPIDEYFGYQYGKLIYRGQQREHRYLPDVQYAQPCGQVNNPAHAGGPHIRALEWKHMMQKHYADRITGTVLSTEMPYTPDDPTAYEYPFPDETNARLYRRYRECADSLQKVLICGRLGEYRYYDMDQAIGRAIVLAEKILAAG